MRASRESLQGDVRWAVQEGSQVPEASLVRRVKPAVSGSIQGRWRLVDRDLCVLKRSSSIIGSFFFFFLFPREDSVTRTVRRGSLAFSSITQSPQIIAPLIMLKCFTPACSARRMHSQACGHTFLQVKCWCIKLYQVMLWLWADHVALEYPVSSGSF